MKKINYKMIFVDIDGTLITSKGEIPEKTVYAFKKLKENGVEVVINSGRQRSNVAPISELAQAGRYIITGNGSDIYDRVNKKCVYSDIIPVESLKKLYRVMTDFDMRYRLISEDTAYINKELHDPLDETLVKDDMKTILETKPINQVVAYHNNFYTLDEVKRNINGISGIEMVNQNKVITKEMKNFFLDITIPGTNKATGIKHLCDYAKIPLNETICFGDDRNDIPMLKVCGLGVAMGNSPSDVIPYADIVTDTNDNDGIYKALKSLFDFID